MMDKGSILILLAGFLVVVFGLWYLSFRVDSITRQYEDRQKFLSEQPCEYFNNYKADELPVRCLEFYGVKK